MFKSENVMQTGEFVEQPPIVIGRDEEDLSKYTAKGTIEIGKHIVGTGEDSHLTTPVLLDVLRPHLILLTGKRGSGKCLDGDTLITLQDGRQIKIKDIENKDLEILALNDDLKLMPAKKEGFYKRTSDRLLEVNLRSGRKIKLTPEHPLLTIKGWKPVQELTIGSRIATPRKLDFFGSEKIQDCKVKLLAYLLAEGHIRQHGKIKLARFTNFDNIIIEDFTKSTKEFDNDLCVSKYKEGSFGIINSKFHTTKITERNTKGQIVKFEKQSMGNSVISWLEELGVYGKLSKEKIIPEIVFRLGKENIKLFLNRLFSCDGSIYYANDNCEISYSSSSEKMIRQVQHLMLKFGVVSKLRKKNIKLNGKYFNSFEIVVNGYFCDVFLREIGFFGKKEERQKIALEKSIVRNTNIDTIPKEIWENFKPENWAAIGRAFGYAYPKAMRESKRYSPSRQKLFQIAMVENNTRLKALAESDIFWDEIISMELLEGNFEVYDISVPEHHNFVANDIIVHNSYSLGTIAEELTKVPESVRKNLCSIIIDTQGIFWTMKTPSEKDFIMLAEWKLKPKGFDVFVYIPEGQAQKFSKAGVEYDDVFSFAPYELSPYDWVSVFGLEPNKSTGITLLKAMKKLKPPYSIDDIISSINATMSSLEDKMALESMFLAAEDWGIFGESRSPDVLVPGKTSVIDVSLTPENVRALLVSMIANKIMEERVTARRKEELADVQMLNLKRVPMPWFMKDEAHNFLPADSTTPATDILNKIVKEGRQPGITLVFATQRPEKLHQDALAQADMIISHRITSKNDIEALKAIMQTYLLFDIAKYINELPKLKGTAIILDDNSERIYKVRIRPRQSWHAGSSPVAL